MRGFHRSGGGERDHHWHRRHDHSHRGSPDSTTWKSTAATAKKRSWLTPAAVPEKEDLRTLPVLFDSHDKRSRPFMDAAALSTQTEWDDYSISGPRTARFVLREFIAKAMVPTSRRHWWKQSIGATPGEAGIDEQHFLCEVLGFIAGRNC